MVHLEELFDFFGLVDNVNVQKDGHIKHQLHRSLSVDALLAFQVVKEVLELSGGLSENLWVLEDERSHNLLIEPVLVNEERSQSRDALIALLVVQQEVWLLSSDVPLFFDSETISVPEVSSASGERLSCHLQHHL